LLATPRPCNDSIHVTARWKLSALLLLLLLLLPHRYVEMTLYLTSSKMPFTGRAGHLTKARQKDKHDTASQLLEEYANKNWSHR